MAFVNCQVTATGPRPITIKAADGGFLYSTTSGFFVNLVDNTSLDYQNANSPGYAVFGTVVQGMGVVDAIGGVATGTVNGFSDVPTTDVTISFALQTK